jgi:caffeoyl-CoA O-methyltransferase
VQIYADGTPRLDRLRQIPPETSKFLALIAVGAPGRCWIEIGTSAGYSTMGLALTARAVGAAITTVEVLPGKIALARETFQLTNIGDVVTLVEGDSRAVLAHYHDMTFCFLDAEKEIYADCYNLVRGGLMVAVTRSITAPRCTPGWIAHLPVCRKI